MSAGSYVQCFTHHDKGPLREKSMKDPLVIVDMLWLVDQSSHSSDRQSIIKVYTYALSCPLVFRPPRQIWLTASPEITTTSPRAASAASKAF